MANVDNPHGFMPVGMLDGSADIPLMQIELATNATVEVGDVLTKNTAGYFRLATAAELPYYIAAEDATSATAGDTIPAVPTLQNILFEGQCSGTPTRASHWGAVVDIEGSNGIFEVNEDASTNDTIRIIGLYDDPDNSIGANARVLFHFVETAWAGMPRIGTDGTAS